MQLKVKRACHQFYCSGTFIERTMELTELRTWVLSRSFRNEVFEISKTFPNEEKYALTQQVIRSSRSISANIAEGHGRFHFKENIQFCRIARASLQETLDHLICAFDCGYISQHQLDEYIKKSEVLMKTINAYISSMKQKIS